MVAVLALRGHFISASCSGARLLDVETPAFTFQLFWRGELSPASPGNDAAQQCSISHAAEAAVLSWGGKTGDVDRTPDLVDVSAAWQTGRTEQKCVPLCLRSSATSKPQGGSDSGLVPLTCGLLPESLPRKACFLTCGRASPPSSVPAWPSVVRAHVARGTSSAFVRVASSPVWGPI